MVLTLDQVNIIQDQFSVIAKNKKQNSVDFFIALFTKYPEYQEKFDDVKGLSLEELKTSPQLKTHGLTFINTLHSMVENFDDQDSLIPLLRKYAESEHAKGMSKEIIHNTWGLLPSYLGERLGASYTEEGQEAWAACVRFMSEVTDSACDSIDAAKNESALLTPEQIELVQDQWAVLAKNKKQSGTDIFIALFTHYPEFQNLFKMFQGLSLEEIRASHKMKAHGLTFMHGLQGFIENLDDIETLVELVRKMAERHGGRGITVDAFHKTFGLFPAILKSKLGDAFDETSQEAWGIVVKTMESVTTARLEEFYKDMGKGDL